MSALVDRLLLEVLAALSWLYPPAFRRELAPILRDGIGQRIRIEVERGGFAPRLRAAAVLSCDWGVTMVREWTRRRGGNAAIHARAWEIENREGMMLRGLEELVQLIRAFRRRPMFGLTAASVLAVGVAGTTLVGTLAYEILLRPLPYTLPETLVMVWQADPEGGDRQNVAPGVFHDISRAERVFDDAAAMIFFSNGVSHRVDGRLLAATARQVSPRFFDLLGVQPVLGRTFFAADAAIGATPIVLLSHQIWSRDYGADPSVVGRSIEVGGRSVEVVGVLPAEFEFPGVAADFWVPLVWDPDIHFSMDASQRAIGNLHVVARLRSDVDLTAARVEASALAGRISSDWEDAPADLDLRVELLSHRARGTIGAPLTMVLAAVLGLLALACVNVAALYLGRAVVRIDGLALRAALGAGRGALVRRAALESSLYAFLGGVIGVVVAWWSFDPLLELAPFPLPRRGELSMGVTGMLIGVGATILCAGLTSVIPCLQARSVGERSALGVSDRRVTRAPSALRTLFVSCEVMLTMVLLVGAGLLLRSFANVVAVDAGFDPEELLALEIATPPRVGGDAQAVIAAYDELFELLRLEGGATSMSTVSRLPIRASSVTTTLEEVGRPVPIEEREPMEFRRVSPGHFAMVGAQVLAGREFTRDDRVEGEPALVLNRAAAGLLVGEATLAVGRRVRWGGDARGHTVIGVVEDISQFGLDRPPPPAVYLSASQAPSTSTVLMVRIGSGADAAGVEDVVRAWNPDLPLQGGRLMNDVIDDSLGPRRTVVGALAVFALTALLIAVAGVYGVFSQWTAERTRELGIRIALGSSSAGALGLVARSGFRAVGTGLAVGAAVSAVLTRAMEGLLFGVTSVDPMTFLLASTLLGLAALAACVIAARAALVVDPAQVLAGE